MLFVLVVGILCEVGGNLVESLVLLVEMLCCCLIMEGKVKLFIV